MYHKRVFWDARKDGRVQSATCSCTGLCLPQLLNTMEREQLSMVFNDSLKAKRNHIHTILTDLELSLRFSLLNTPETLNLGIKMAM